jgi:hypothetical protein
MINTFDKVVGYKINIQNSVVVLYTNNKQTKSNHRISPISNSLTKQTGINLTKEVKDLYNESYEMLKKKI